MKLGRRHILRGAGGFVFALPWLPSLERSALAQGPGSSPRRFIAMRTEHGGVRGPSAFPAESMLTQTQSYVGHTIRRGDLTVGVSGGTASVSPMLSAPSSVFTPALAQKMNVLRGLDINFYISHHRGGTLGNYGDTDTAGTWQHHPTCDQVLAWSSKFYDNLSTNLMRSMALGGANMSWGYSNPQNPASTVQAMQNQRNSRALFDQIFRVPTEPNEPVLQRAPIVNRVFADYQRLRDGNRRLSSRDRNRLEDHMSRIDELERKLSVSVTNLSCGDVTPPTMSTSMLTDGEAFNSYARDPVKHAQFWGLMNDVITVAMTCDTSRIVTMRLDGYWHNNSEAASFSEFAGDWHQDIAHQAFGTSAQVTMLASKQRVFEHVFLDLATKLDAVESPHGGTLLDSCAMFWGDESGVQTHDSISMPVITAGSANGWLTTGSYIDYSNRNVICHNGEGDLAGEVTHAGLLYHQFLGTMMQSMGLAPADYEAVPGGGYGLHLVDPASHSWWAGYQKHSAAVRNAAGQPLPFLKA